MQRQDVGPLCSPRFVNIRYSSSFTRLKCRLIFSLNRQRCGTKPELSSQSCVTCTPLPFFAFNFKVFICDENLEPTPGIYAPVNQVTRCYMARLEGA